MQKKVIVVLISVLLLVGMIGAVFAAGQNNVKTFDIWGKFEKGWVGIYNSFLGLFGINVQLAPEDCGDAVCDAAIGENCNSCSEDCGQCPYCGDGYCNNGETCSSCSTDCGSCPFCGDANCDAGENCNNCPADCDDGTCIGECDPACVNGAVCLNGGCECPNACDGITQCGLPDRCNMNTCPGACVGPDEGKVCSTSEYWYGLWQCVDCTETCDDQNAECGVVCNEDCGTCPAGETCENRICVGCTSSCDEGIRICGDDGCGGSCGPCPAGTICSADGTSCECVPNCEALGHNCGDDGCGGSCGTCEEGSECIDGVCGCQSQCNENTCGDDGCGGSCECNDGYVCNEDSVCVCDPSKPLEIKDIESVNVFLDPSYVEDTKKPISGGGRGITPTDITPYDDIIVEVKVKKPCPSDPSENPAPERLDFSSKIVADSQDIVDGGSSALAKVSGDSEKDETNDYVWYQWKITGWPSGIVGESGMESLVSAIADSKNIVAKISKGSSKESAISFSNCVHTSGSGSITIASHRMASSTEPQIKTSEVFAKSEAFKINGIEVINPFKTYSDSFSYYVNLEKVELFDFNRPPHGRNLAPYLSQSNTCVKKLNFLYNNQYGGSSASDGEGTMLISMLKDQTRMIRTQFHELGHEFCKLGHESDLLDSDTSGLPVAEPNSNLCDSYTTCTNLQPRMTTDGSSIYIYKGIKYADAFPSKENYLGAKIGSYWQPGKGSVMYPAPLGLYQNARPELSLFNTVSCGYCISAIEGGDPMKYWPQCACMDGVVGPDGICTGTCNTCDYSNQDCCDNTCIDIKSDNANCGSCGNACPNIEDNCINGKCVSNTCLGCQTSERGCVGYGYRFLDANGDSSYCDIDGSTYQQKADGESCENSHECTTNVCSNGKCVSIEKTNEEISGIKIILMRILCKLSNLIDDTGYEECITNSS